MSKPLPKPPSVVAVDDPAAVTQLYGVGAVLAKKLTKIGVHTIQDLLFHLPVRYEDRTRTVAIGELRAGQAISVEGLVKSSGIVFAGRRSLVVRIEDDSGALTLRFFHFSKSQQQRFVEGALVRCYGEPRLGRQGMQMIHPTCRVVDDSDAVGIEEKLTPIYATTEGLQQARLKALTTQSLNQLGKRIQLEELLPAAMLEAPDWPSLAAAIAFLHRPPPEADLELLAAGRHPAQRRLAFEELLGQHLSLRRLRELVRRDDAYALPSASQLVDQFIQALPFSLTPAQARVSKEIAQDLVVPHPMMRLLQGDVGAGKTVVAALAALRAIEAGHQVALMAPTELLAEQHLHTFYAWFEPLGIRVVWLTGRLKRQERHKVLREMNNGTAQMVIGTHALFQEQVKFKDLALLIVDEQHRFGVHQRLELRKKGAVANASENFAPHQLVMTATPIPRTLAMTLYADLDYSVLDGLPPGRKPVQTVAIDNQRRDEVIARVRSAVAAGQQAYWVCPLVEESEFLQAEAAEKTHEYLCSVLPELVVGLVHGRVKAEQKAAAMQQFKNGDIQVLVATTVVEVGVDVPNASLMIIENPERMGLSQLHQLRGRVGRGAAQSHCVLLYQGPLSDLAKQRLGVMRDTNDGFEIAAKDLALRGPGEVLGTRQTGAAQMKIANLVRDADLIPEVQRIGVKLLQEQPARAVALIDRWVGYKQDYADV